MLLIMPFLCFKRSFCGSVFFFLFSELFLRFSIFVYDFYFFWGGDFYCRVSDFLVLLNKTLGPRTP